MGAWGGCVPHACSLVAYFPPDAALVSLRPLCGCSTTSEQTSTPRTVAGPVGGRVAGATMLLIPRQSTRGRMPAPSVVPSPASTTGRRPSACCRNDSGRATPAGTAALSYIHYPRLFRRGVLSVLPHPGSAILAPLLPRHRGFDGPLSP